MIAGANHRGQLPSARESPWTPSAARYIPASNAAATSLPRFPAGLEEKFAKFTEGERAVLKIVSGEVVKRGACTLTWDAIADLSTITRRVVRTALRTAKAEGLIKVERGPRYNTITLSETWKAWLDRYGDAPPDGPR
jgi:hypothetical protein